MTELLRYVALVDLGGGSKPLAQGMPRKLLLSLAFRQIAAYAGGERLRLTSRATCLVGQPFPIDRLAVPAHAPKQRPCPMRPNLNQVPTTG